MHVVSDNCTGQDRKLYRVTMLWPAMNKHSFLQEIGHCFCFLFLERGHTQNESGSVYSVISRAAKNIFIFIPSDCFDLNQHSVALKNFERD